MNRLTKKQYNLSYLNQIGTLKPPTYPKERRNSSYDSALPEICRWVREIGTWPIVVMKANPQKALELLIGLGYFIPIKHAPAKFRDIDLIKDKNRVIKLAKDIVKGEEEPFSTDIFELINFFDPRYF